RIIGYDEVPAEPLVGEIPPGRPGSDRDLAERLRDVLVAAGLQEVINYSLVSRELLDRIPGLAVEPIKVTNPLSVEQEYLRPTLRASVLQNAAANQRWSPESLRFFEVDKTFHPREGDLPDERRQVVGLIAGLRRRPSWFGQLEKVDFYDAKGIVEAILDSVQVPNVRFEPGNDDLFHPGKVARVLSGDLILGGVGEVHPLIVDQFDLDVRPMYLFELEVSALLAAQTATTTYIPLPRFPAVVQDLALVVDRDVPAGALQSALAEADLVASVELFDVYEGDPLPPGRKSLAYHISYQSPDRTLTDADVQSVQDELVRRMHDRFGATLRG
ncbi:MAG TPA: hypothetical protein VHL09_09360, partial [Dehalococcoidia bacterium]|nr:hypothetical protein [Dehalococcoidia bacterium]